MGHEENRAGEGGRGHLTRHLGCHAEEIRTSYRGLRVADGLSLGRSPGSHAECVSGRRGNPAAEHRCYLSTSEMIPKLKA